MNYEERIWDADAVRYRFSDVVTLKKIDMGTARYIYRN